MLTRRFLFFIGLSLVLSMNSFGLPAEAKDGESDGGSQSGSDHSSEDNSGQGSGRESDSRSGSSSNDESERSLSTKDIDHNDSHDDQQDKNERKRSEKWQTDQDKALDAARKGKIISLKDALEHVATKYEGKVISVSLRTTSTREIYQMKIRTPDGTIQEVRMDARTGKFAGLFGF